MNDEQFQHSRFGSLGLLLPGLMVFLFFAGSLAAGALAFWLCKLPAVALVVAASALLLLLFCVRLFARRARPSEFRSQCGAGGNWRVND